MQFLCRNLTYLNHNRIALHFSPPDMHDLVLETKNIVLLYTSPQDWVLPYLYRLLNMPFFFYFSAMRYGALY